MHRISESDFDDVDDQKNWSFDETKISPFFFADFLLLERLSNFIHSFGCFEAKIPDLRQTQDVEAHP